MSRAPRARRGRTPRVRSIATIEGSAAGGVLVIFTRPPRGRTFTRALIACTHFATQKQAEKSLTSTGYVFASDGLVTGMDAPATPAWLRLEKGP